MNRLPRAKQPVFVRRLGLRLHSYHIMRGAQHAALENLETPSCIYRPILMSHEEKHCTA